MIQLSARRLSVLSAVFCLAGSVSMAHADWAACQSKPTCACLLEEALRGDGGTQLAGKNRLDVLEGRPVRRRPGAAAMRP